MIAPVTSWVIRSFSERDGTPSMMRVVFGVGSALTITMVIGLITYLTIKDGKFPAIPAETGGLIASMQVALLGAKVWQSNIENKTNANNPPDPDSDPNDRLREYARDAHERSRASESRSDQDARR